jgi:hypothetical protein
MDTLKGAVEGCAPMGAGPSGRARWRKASLSAMVEERIRAAEWERREREGGGSGCGRG